MNLRNKNPKKMNLRKMNPKKTTPKKLHLHPPKEERNQNLRMMMTTMTIRLTLPLKKVEETKKEIRFE